jgi:DNA-binding NtrC family response regulator
MLPLQRPLAKSIDVQLESRAMSKRAYKIGSKPPVLVLSYEPMIRFLLAEALALEGYLPHVVTDGEEGLMLLQQATEGSVVLLQVDPYSGIRQLMQMVLENDRLHDHHRIIHVDSGYQFTATAHPLRPDDVLAMPFSANQLAQVVGRNLAKLRPGHMW